MEYHSEVTVDYESAFIQLLPKRIDHVRACTSAPMVIGGQPHVNQRLLILYYVAMKHPNDHYVVLAAVRNVLF